LQFSREGRRMSALQEIRVAFGLNSKFEPDRAPIAALGRRTATRGRAGLAAPPSRSFDGRRAVLPMSVRRPAVARPTAAVPTRTSPRHSAERRARLRILKGWGGLCRRVFRPRLKWGNLQRKCRTKNPARPAGQL
jgi:hypothetical protein